MQYSRTVVVATVLATVFFAQARDAWAQPAYEITAVRDGLYQLRDGARSTVFLVTPNGIVLGDPLDHAAASWLRAELATRFPDVAVRYVVMTHAHYDRAEGNGVFATPAELIAHATFDVELRKARQQLPDALRALDRNGNGRLEIGELGDDETGRLLASKDRDSDGIVTTEEIHRRIVAAERDFNASRTLEIGASRVRIIATRGVHTPDSALIFFPAERVVFASHGPAVTVTPFQLREYTTKDVRRWMRAVLALDFDLLLMGDGTSISKSALTDLDAYLSGVVKEVARGYVEGVSVTDLQARAASTVSPHSAAQGSQIADMYHSLRMLRVDVGGVPMASYGFRQGDYCEGTSACSSGGVIGTLDTSVKLLVGQRFVIDTGLTWSRQSWSSRTAANYQEEYAFRSTRGSALFGVSTRQSRRTYLAVLGGLSVTVGSTQGAARLSGLLRASERSTIDVRDTRFGIAAGTELGLRLHPRIRLVVPVRFDKALGESKYTWPHRMDVQVGTGLTYTLFKTYQ